MRYDQDWHHHYGLITSQSAHKMIGYLRNLFNIHSAIEFGCGHAHWLEAAEKLGVSDIRGLDGEWTELDQLRIDQSKFHIVDLEKPVDLKRKFDLAICMEVGEHLHQNASAQFINSICKHADLVLYGAAIPLQGGFKHINEKWQSFWAGHFHAEGYRAFDLMRPVFWSDTGIHYYYRQNALIYISQNAKELIARAERLGAELQSNPILDIVHPEKYIESADYESIAFKRLLPVLPRAVWSVLRRRLPF